MHGVSNRGTRLCPLQTSHQFTWQQQHRLRVAQWADHQRKAEWTDNPTRLRIFIPDTGTHPPGMALPRRAWVRLNRLRTGVGRFCSYLYKWGMASSAACECGAEEQTVDHVAFQCPIHRPPHGLHGLTVLDDETIEWLLNICPEILHGQAVVWTTSSKEEITMAATACHIRLIVETIIT